MEIRPCNDLYIHVAPALHFASSSCFQLIFELRYGDKSFNDPQTMVLQLSAFLKYLFPTYIQTWIRRKDPLMTLQIH
ncbi:hypothetical protein ES332_A05G348300v1 [Gossypium tomentosum]|uniref:Uncharacterized protein n=1 Tax=Gossypium tomentosum TaxID=34277 RepID=A0A5D2QR48_GOSTO|nr:hypothetical protein ES332_A05G348300v1 [Gossypium tomentosum]